MYIFSYFKFGLLISLWFDFAIPLAVQQWNLNSRVVYEESSLRNSLKNQYNQ